MLSFSSKQRYFLGGPPTDLRKGFAGLSGLVRGHIGDELMSSDVFIFVNWRLTAKITCLPALSRALSLLP